MNQNTDLQHTSRFKTDQSWNKTQTYSTPPDSRLTNHEPKHRPTAHLQIQDWPIMKQNSSPPKDGGKLFYLELLTTTDVFDDLSSVSQWANQLMDQSLIQSINEQINQ